MSVWQGQIHDTLAITELRGGYPNVPIAMDVDYPALIAGDDEPMFLTIPIGKVGATSSNKRHYDDAFVQELERQTLSNKPIGLMGHLSDSDRATAFPPEAAHWVGALREGDTLWGKAYIVPGPVRERIARYKAQGKAIATSIDAYAEGVFDQALGAYRMSAKSLRLNQIDIAPADRAGIPDLAAIPILTTEMDTPAPPDSPEETLMDKLQVINEMTADDARLLPKPVREAVIADLPTPPEVTTIQAIRQILEVGPDEDVASLITEMRRTLAAQTAAAVQARITELASAEDTGIKVDSVRGLVTELVYARHPSTVAEAEAAYTAVVELPAVKAALTSAIQTIMGPPQTTPVAGKAAGNKYFDIPMEVN